MTHGLHCPKFLSLFQTGNVSYALSLSQELLHHGNSFHFTCPFPLIQSVVHKQSQFTSPLYFSEQHDLIF